jgi:WD40 repeat protein
LYNIAHLWDAESGRDVVSPLVHEKYIRRAVFSPDSRTLATACDDNVARIWDAESGTIKLAFRQHNQIVNTVAFDAAGKRVASTSWDGTLRIWDAATGDETQMFSAPGGRAFRGVAFHSEGHLVASSDDGGFVRIWDLDRRTEARSISGPLLNGFIPDLAFSPNGRTLAISSQNPALSLWDPLTGILQGELRGHYGSSAGINFSNDSRYLASANDDTTIRIWKLSPGLEPLPMAKSLRGARTP